MLTVRAAAAEPLDVDADLLVVPVFKGGIEGPGAAQALSSPGARRLPGDRDVPRRHRADPACWRRRDCAPAACCWSGWGAWTPPTRRGCGVRPASPRAPRRRSRASPRPWRRCTPLAGAVGAVAEGFHLGAYADRRFRTDDGARGAARGRRSWCPRPCCRRPRAALAPRRGLRARDDRRARPGQPAAGPQAPGGAGRSDRRAALPADCEVGDPRRGRAGRGGFGGMLAVGRGSDAPPRLVEIRYRPENPLGHVVLVGKGITFDTGGLSLKRGPSMNTMKSDMAGAAAVAATCRPWATWTCALEVTGLLRSGREHARRGCAAPRRHHHDPRRARPSRCSTPTPRAAWSWPTHWPTGPTQEPDAIVDLATLTGTAIQASARTPRPLMGNDDDLADALAAAGQVAGEPCGGCPCGRPRTRSSTPPSRTSTTPATAPARGSITAGLFLQPVRRRHPVGAPGHRRPGVPATKREAGALPARRRHRLRRAHAAGVAGAPHAVTR